MWPLNNFHRQILGAESFSNTGRNPSFCEDELVLCLKFVKQPYLSMNFGMDVVPLS
jgi:hypothetical protein